MNTVIFIAGLLLLTVLLGYPRSGKWDHAIATWYFLLQIFPILQNAYVLQSRFYRIRAFRRFVSNSADFSDSAECW